MLKLLKNMRRKEIIMALICIVLIVGQVYFDLRLPDYMTDLTSLIKTSGSTGDILNVGLKMLGCTAVSAVLAIACGFLAAKTASGFSYTVRGKLFHHIMDIGSEEMQDFLGSEPDNKNHKRHHTDTDGHIDGTSDDNQSPDNGCLGGDQDTRQELGAFGGHGGRSSSCSAAPVLAIMATCIPRLRLVQKMTDRDKPRRASRT